MTNSRINGAGVDSPLGICSVAKWRLDVAPVYNWWSLFVRCAQSERPREAITSRPLLLHAIGRVITTGRQTVLRLTSNHAEAADVQKILSDLSLFLSGLLNAAEQLTSSGGTFHLNCRF